MISRKYQQYLKIVVITSLCWCILDVWILNYFSGCANSQPPEPLRHKAARAAVTEAVTDMSEAHIDASNNNNDGGIENSEEVPEENVKSKKGFFDNIIPDALKPAKSMPGDGGNRVNIPTELEAKSKESFKINQFNLVASDLMSINRSLPDYRMSQCVSKASTYDIDVLPDTSVIIVFHNEAWSTLLRTVHSVINRSPRKLLKEIIMVDDASDQDHLKQRLDDYVAKMPVPVRILRTPQRGGLIRARLKGAKAAIGDVLTFLDAHCECTIGWLEPLLFEIHRNRRAAVCPIIDVIDDNSFAYISGSDMTWGGFNWRLNFRWYPVPQRETSRRNGDRSIPLRSPTMAGGLFSIERHYFYEVGSYDSGMNIWGGENLEMSFRIWQCGGEVLIATCSRVGHVFRKISPYSWPGGVAAILNHNTQRIADVWMDEYKDFFYKTNPGVKDTDPGDMTDRHNLRKKLECKSFRWYLENIYPESNLPLQYVALGQMKNPVSGYCLDSAGKKSGEMSQLFQCHGQGGNQAFALTEEGAIQADDTCVLSHGNVVKLGGCHSAHDWSYIKQDKQLKSRKAGLCLAAVDHKPVLEKCILGKPSQVWELDNLTT